jgi:hypothetical protein
MKTRFPDAASKPASPEGAKAEPASTTGTLPEIAGIRRVGAVDALVSKRADASPLAHDSAHENTHGK